MTRDTWVISLLHETFIFDNFTCQGSHYKLQTLMSAYREDIFDVLLFRCSRHDKQKRSHRWCLTQTWTTWGSSWDWWVCYNDLHSSALQLYPVEQRHPTVVMDPLYVSVWHSTAHAWTTRLRQTCPLPSTLCSRATMNLVNRKRDSNGKDVNNNSQILEKLGIHPPSHGVNWKKEKFNLKYDIFKF